MKKVTYACGIVSEIWGKANPHYYKDQDIKLFTITNENQMTLKLSDLGASIISCILPDGRDVIVGDKDSKYFPQTEPSPHFGATIGRLCGRSGATLFVCNNRGYTLPANEDGINHLHGGVMPMGKKVWRTDIIESTEATGIRFYYLSPHLEEEYPGTMNVEVSITLNKSANIITIGYKVNSDTNTPVNLTNHSYFNLGDSTVLNNRLRIVSDSVYVLDKNPSTRAQNSGVLQEVSNTPFDFRKNPPIAPSVSALMQERGGIDHIWKISNNVNTSASIDDMVLTAELESEDGTVLETHSTASALVCYTGNFLGKYLTGSRAYKAHEAICLETQHAPGFLHNKNIPPSLVEPGQLWKSYTQFIFKKIHKEV